MSFAHASHSFAWRAADLAGAAAWRVDLQNADLAAAAHEVRAGRGFVVLRGLGGATLEEFKARVGELGRHFGAALSQNAQGERIAEVIDASGEDATPRLYRSKLELRMHSDIAAIVVLACWRRAAAGGATLLSSGVAVHDAIAARAPQLLERLYRGYRYHRLGEEGEGEPPVTPWRVPVFACRGGQLSCRYQRAAIAAGHAAAGEPLEPADLEALDLLDATALSAEHRLAVPLEPGDVLVLNNYALLHARTAFTEHPEPERRRCLVRVWLDAPGFRDVPRELHLFGANGVPPQPGRRASFDFRKLYAENPAAGGLPDLELH